MAEQDAVVLLDVDGVLNPLRRGDTLALESPRADLVRDLASFGEIVWATTWASTFIWRLGRDLGLSSDTRSIAFPDPIDANPELPAPTPKLYWVSRWLLRSFEADEQPPLVWIDDHLSHDVTEWASDRAAPTLLIRPDPQVGLLSKHVDQVREFLR